MQTIATKVQIGDDRTLSVQLPKDAPTGEYEVVVVLNQCIQADVAPDMTAIQKIQSLLKQSVEPGYSLADELVQERREIVNNVEAIGGSYE
jgi:hypothetical protein